MSQMETVFVDVGVTLDIHVICSLVYHTTMCKYYCNKGLLVRVKIFGPFQKVNFILTLYVFGSHMSIDLLDFGCLF